MPFGLTLSSEEHPPARLVAMAAEAEEHGFDFVSISDHFHPWVGEQGHSPFVWSVLGGISQVTDELHVGVGVTCPTTRIHPAILAQATATTANLLPGRFTWGVGTGEALNELILGHRWPPAEVRRSQLREAVEVVRRLWTGESVTHRGEHYLVEDARIFDVPPGEVPIVVSGFGPESTKLAAEIGDGFWTTGPDGDPVERYRSAGGTGPVWSQVTFCWAPDRDEAVERAHRLWPNTSVPGQLSQDLRTVLHFEQATSNVTPDDIAGSLPCGPDVGPIVDSVRAAVDGGITHLYLHQIGDPADGFYDVWDAEIRPELDKLQSDPA